MNSVSAQNNNLNQDNHRTVGSEFINNTQEQVVIVLGEWRIPTKTTFNNNTNRKNQARYKGFKLI